MEEQGIRINKYLSEAGVCSRREADRQIALGNVTVDGRVIAVGDRLFAGQRVVFCGQPVQEEEEAVLLLVHKPVGIVCTAEKREKNNIINFLQYPKRIYPVGRLDKNSSGLLLMTNQGALVNQIMRARNRHEKEYLVTVQKPLTEEFLRGMAGGVPLKELGVMTRECLVEQTGSRQFRIVLTQGLNRQIRRMCEYFGYRVTALVRVRIMNLHLGDLAPGTYREITPQELAELKRQLSGSAHSRAQEHERNPSRPERRLQKSARDCAQKRERNSLQPVGRLQKSARDYAQEREQNQLQSSGGQQWKQSRQKRDGRN